ncbi:MAG TPA: tetratricopeptide repeat protein, partial [Acidobacteriota bacterium]|nr:tetratricopeptide repeat protein [Acidobacteriota bacterium]
MLTSKIQSGQVPQEGAEYLKGELSRPLDLQERLLIYRNLYTLSTSRPAEFYEDWRQAAEAAGRRDIATWALAMRAYTHRQRSQLGSALESAYEARARLDEFKHSRATKHLVLKELGRILMRLGRFPEAACFMQGAAEALEAQNGGISQRTVQGMADALNELGFVRFKQGRTEEAFAAFERVRELSERFDLALPYTLSFLDRWATVLQWTGHADEARTRFTEAVTIFQEHYQEDREQLNDLLLRNAGYVYMNWAALEAESGNVAASRAKFEMAKRLVCESGWGFKEACKSGGAESKETPAPGSSAGQETGTGPTSDDQQNSELAPNELAAYYRTEALIAKADNRPQRAVELLERSLDLLYAMRSSEGSGNSTLEFDSARHELYVDPLVSLLMIQGRERDALMREERSRARQLNSMIDLENPPRIRQELLEREAAA